MTRRRGFGELERRTGATGPSYRARYAMPDGSRHSRNFRTKMDAEMWLASERSLIDRDEWTPPKYRKVAEARREREQAMNTVKAYAERYVAVNRAGESGDSVAWEGWSHVRENVDEVAGRAA